MGEVQDELDRALLEDGTARVTADMAARDLWRAFKAGRGSKSFAERAWPEGAPFVLDITTDPRAIPARPLRLRVHLDPVDGPLWLGLLAQCAWLRGGILAPQITPT